MSTIDKEEIVSLATLAHFHATRGYLAGHDDGKGHAGNVGRALCWQWAEQGVHEDRVRELLVEQKPSDGDERLSVGDEAAIDVFRMAGLLPWPHDVPIPDLAAVMAARRPSPAVEVRPAAPVASGGVEVRGVVATVEGDVRRIEGDSCRVFWFEEGRWFPRWPGAKVGQRVIVSIRLADPTGGG